MALCSKAEATTKQSAYEIEYSPLYLYSAASKIRGFVTGRMLGVDHIATLQAEMLPLLNISAPFSDRIVADYLTELRQDSICFQPFGILSVIGVYRITAPLMTNKPFNDAGS